MKRREPFLEASSVSKEGVKIYALAGCGLRRDRCRNLITPMAPTLWIGRQETF